LQRLQNGGTYTVASLTRELGVSEALLELMIEDLVRMGYLAPVTGSCSGQCARCPLAKACTIGGSTRVWALTEKGSHKMQDARGKTQDAGCKRQEARCRRQDAKSRKHGGGRWTSRQV